MATDRLILNIGLNGVTPLGQGYTNGKANPETVAKVMACAQALRREGFVYLDNKLLQSDTEWTWAVEVAYDPRRPEGYTGVFGAVRMVAAALNQDVIAIYDEKKGEGFMRGRDIDHDDAWGEFNPALFFMPDGRRLSDVLAAA
jgi:hypothetical protein